MGEAKILLFAQLKICGSTKVSYIHFTSTAVSPSKTIFMGFDKHENEELIRWGFDEDDWFHVDRLSSAHVYLRLKEGETIDNIPAALLEDCCQLVKQNSIEGCKKNDVDIVYTMWSNLKKTSGMDVGQVIFHNHKEVKKVRIEKKINEIINRLNKTKVERTDVDFRAEREAEDAKKRQRAKDEARKRAAEEAELAKKREEEKALRSYDTLFKPENMTTNCDSGEDSDDFM